MQKKVALVTGGVGDIGTAICKELLDQGHRVVAGHHVFEEEAARQWQVEHRRNGDEFELAAGDVANFESAKAMVDRLRGRFGGVDILVNCAGITRDGFLKKLDPEKWYDVINVNLNSVFNVTRQVIMDMMSRNFGRIVNISSVNGQKGQWGQTNYSAAKAGVHGFTMALAQEGARSGVTVNTVSPGYVKTRMTAAIDSEILDSIVQAIPMARMATPREVARAVGFLCQEDSGYITGANLPINGGMFTSF